MQDRWGRQARGMHFPMCSEHDQERLVHWLPFWEFDQLPQDRPLQRGPVPMMWSAAVPPGGRLVTGLLGENPCHPQRAGEPRAGKAPALGHPAARGPQPPGQCCGCSFGFSKVFPGPVTSLQSLGVSAEDPLNPRVSLGLTGQGDLNFALTTRSPPRRQAQESGPTAQSVSHRSKHTS